MSIFSVDSEKCQRDGLCVAECPLYLIELPDQEATPSPIPQAAELCINCGHCAAVCPHGALELAAMPLESMPPLNPALALTPQQAEQFLRCRRSIRLYKDDMVPPDQITRLIEMARYAPSGHNRQPARWLVISGRDKLKPLAGLVIDWMDWVSREQPDLAARMHMDRVMSQWEAGRDRVLRDAPHLIVAHAPKAERTAPAAGTIALAYLELAATALGLGACWAGYFGAAAATFPPLQKALALPEDHAGLGAMMVGFPKFQYHRLPARNPPEISWR